jgi:hypothetical protein
MRAAERRYHRGRGVNPGTGVGGRRSTREMRAAERRYHKGRGANPGMGVNPGAVWAGGGVPAKCEPRSGVIIKAGVLTPALMWTDVDLTFLRPRAVERRNRGGGCKHLGGRANPGAGQPHKYFSSNSTPCLIKNSRYSS